MKTSFIELLFAALALISVNLLVGCAQNGASRLTLNGQHGTPTLGADGTSTSGGGTGINGKVFESYIVDPTQLPAYQQILKPLLDNIKSEDSKDQTSYDKIFKFKTWYIAPVELDKISKNLLGVTFIKSNTQQIARQTATEVWIDKRIYDRMSLHDQTELLLHELVMNMYFFKFISMADMCRMSVMFMGEKNNDGCVDSKDILNQAMPPETPHPLDDQDNANIRFVTGWLMQNAQKPIAETDFIRLLFNKGFDKRMFRPSNYGQDNQKTDLKISGTELFRALKGAQLTGNMPGTCIGLTSGMSKSCTVTVEEKSVSYQSFQITGYNLRLSLQNEMPVNIFFYPSDEATLSASEDNDGNPIYTFSFADWRSQVQIGDRLYSGFLMFKKTPASQTSLSLDSIILKPGIVVSIDKKRDPVCLVSAPKVMNLLDDAILVEQQNAKLTSTQQMLSATPPFAACSADNVTE